MLIERSAVLLGRAAGALLLLASACAGSSVPGQGPSAAECRGQVLSLPPAPVAIDLQGALRCSRDHLYEDDREHRVDEEVIEYAVLACVSGCPAGYQAEWTPQRVEIHPDGSVLFNDVLTGRLDEAGCFRSEPGEVLVRWDDAGRLRSPLVEEPLPARIREGRLELLADGKVVHALSAESGRLLVNGAPCGTIGGAPGSVAGDVALRALPLADIGGALAGQ